MKSKEEITKFIESNKFYHKIDFGDGLITKGAFNPQNEIQVLGIPDLKNKSFMDIGCNAGAYVIEAWKRGSVYSYGVDRNSKQVKKAQEVQRLFEVPEATMKFEVMDIEKDLISSTMKFDIVLMLSVLHHTTQPVKVLQNVYNLTNELAILEIVTRPEGHERALIGFPDTQKPRDKFPTPNAVIAKLKEVGFKKVTLVKANKTEDRIIFHAEK